MHGKKAWVILILGLAAGMSGGWFLFGASKPAAAGNDRYEDYVMCTGPVSVGLVGHDLDGVWMIDYRAGKLLGTCINRNTGKLNPFAEVDLVKEFDVPPRADVHFLMTTGQVARGQAALYVAEPTTGKFAVYTMVVTEGANAGVTIKRHDMVQFRPPAKVPEK